jgi:hypothetical protein
MAGLKTLTTREANKAVVKNSKVCYSPYLVVLILGMRRKWKAINISNVIYYGSLKKILTLIIIIVMRGSYIAHFTNVSMRFTTSGGLFRAAYYGTLAAEHCLQSWGISTLVCYASNWNRLLKRGKPLLIIDI